MSPGFTGRRTNPGGASVQQLRVVLAIAALATVMVACGSTSPSASPSAPSTPAPSAAVTPAPSAAVTDASLETAARAYAGTAGFPLAADGAATFTTAAPDFDPTGFRVVTLPLAAVTPATLAVSFDAAGVIRVVSDSRAWTLTGATKVTKAQALAAAAEAFLQAGIDTAGSKLHVAGSKKGEFWYITLDRSVGGYPVANHPMEWGLRGDKAYVALRGDGTLVELYAIRPATAAARVALPAATLDTKLAKVAGISKKRLVDLAPALTWVRTDGAADLSLNYCASRKDANGWTAWCVDPATGERSMEGGGVD